MKKSALAWVCAAVVLLTSGCGTSRKARQQRIPEMGKLEWSKPLQKADGSFVVELSGLCLSKDQDFLWGVGDNGNLYKINFDGTFENHWTHKADMEGITLNPATGDLYLAIEPSRVYKMVGPSYNDKETVVQVEEAARLRNDGIEAITWYKGDLYLGAQTKAMLWKYSVDGKKLQDTRSLRDVAPTLSEIADLCYDPAGDYLWVMDSNARSREVPDMKPFTLYLFNGDATELLATYDLSAFANYNPESVCVDRAHGCIWVADDCGDDNPSILHKIAFSF
jgi:hypothetical protein